MDPFSFVRLVFCSLRRVFLGVRRRHSSVFPPTVDLRRKRIRLCTGDSRQPEQLGQEKTLGDLLEDYEDLLLRVLFCLVNDGLHECRLVCRRWKDACGKLPVKLGSFCRFRPYKMAELFPEAASLQLRGAFSGNDTPGMLTVQQTSQLRKLEYLSLSATSPEVAINSLIAMLPSPDRLRSLEVLLDQRGILDDIVRALRFLGNLDALTVSCMRVIQTDLDPVTELRGLTYLRIDLPVLVNNRGQLLLPSLERLTHLRLRYFHEDEQQISFSLQVCQFQ